MFADSVLAVAVDCEIKWLYNASHRLARPILRTVDDTRWWRMLHHLAGGLGIPLADAARAADLLMAKDPDTGRVRLSATRDDAVSISVDIARFFDGSALAMSGAIHSVAPRPRGRPRTRHLQAAAGFPAAAALGEIRRRRAATPERRLRSALAIEQPGHAERAPEHAPEPASVEAVPSEVLSRLLELTDGGVSAVVTGSAAAAFHGVDISASDLDLCVSFTARNRTSLAAVLNQWRARPRGVPARDAFRFDSALLRAADVVAVRVGGVALNFAGQLPGVGEYEQVEESSESVVVDGRPLRILGTAALLRTDALSRPSDLATGAALSAVLAGEGTR